ncbi:MAG: NUDIX domain-containing protein [Patescibacteria group bacterium]
MPETTKEISAGIIVYRRTKDGPKFLLLYHGGSYWNFPKGHIEGEEKSLEAALRETVEETGLKQEDLKIRNRFKDYEKYHFYKGKNKIFKVVIFYLAESRKKEVRISEEHSGYGWFLYRDARRILKTYRDSESVLKKAHDFIRGPMPEKQQEPVKTT